ncbi:MAG: PaaI family thioesterase [Acidimicrobiales bacterium]
MQVPPNCDLTLGMVCVDKSRPGSTVWQMTADERFTNTAGIMQGGMLGAFADSAMGASVVTFARQSNPSRVSCVNLEMKASFLRPVGVGSLLTCQATVVSGGARVVFCEAAVYAGEHDLVCKATSTYLVTPRD